MGRAQRTVTDRFAQVLGGHRGKDKEPLLSENPDVAQKALSVLTNIKNPDGTFDKRKAALALMTIDELRHNKNLYVKNLITETAKTLMFHDEEQLRDYLSKVNIRADKDRIKILKKATTKLKRLLSSPTTRYPASLLAQLQPILEICDDLLQEELKHFLADQCFKQPASLRFIMGSRAYTDLCARIGAITGEKAPDSLLDYLEPHQWRQILDILPYPRQGNRAFNGSLSSEIEESVIDRLLESGIISN